MIFAFFSALIIDVDFFFEIAVILQAKICNIPIQMLQYETMKPTDFQPD